MAGKIVADTIEGTTTTETVDGSLVTIPNSVDTKYVVNGTIKAWGHVDHSGDTIPDSFGISSLADDGTGLKDYNFISAFSTASYVGANGMGGNEGTTSNGRLSSVNGVWTTSQAIIKFSQSSNSAVDDVNAFSMFIGDSA